MESGKVYITVIIEGEKVRENEFKKLLWIAFIGVVFFLADQLTFS